MTEKKSEARYAVTVEPGEWTKRTLWLTGYALGMPVWASMSKLALKMSKRKAMAAARRYTTTQRRCGWEEVVS